MFFTWNIQQSKCIFIINSIELTNFLCLQQLEGGAVSRMGSQSCEEEHFHNFHQLQLYWINSQANTLIPIIFKYHVFLQKPFFSISWSISIVFSLISWKFVLIEPCLSNMSSNFVCFFLSSLLTYFFLCPLWDSCSGGEGSLWMISMSCRVSKSIKLSLFSSLHINASISWAFFMLRKLYPYFGLSKMVSSFPVTPE